MTPQQQRLASFQHFDEVKDTILGRCSMCHAAEPAWDGIRTAPKGVKLESDAEITRYARDIYLQAGLSNAMPPANITHLASDERKLIVEWYRSCLLYTSPSPRDLSTSRMPSSA